MNAVWIGLLSVFGWMAAALGIAVLLMRGARRRLKRAGQLTPREEYEFGRIWMHYDDEAQEPPVKRPEGRGEAA